MTHTLPFLHRNARSRKISSAEIREVYIEGITHGLAGRVDREEYLRKVLL